MLTLKNSAKNDVFVIQLRARTGARCDQELNIPVMRIKLDVGVIIILRQAQRNNTTSGMLQQESVGSKSVSVRGQEVQGRMKLP